MSVLRCTHVKDGALLEPGLVLNKQLETEINKGHLA